MRDLIEEAPLDNESRKRWKRKEKCPEAFRNRTRDLLFTRRVLYRCATIAAREVVSSVVSVKRVRGFNASYF